LTSHYLGVRYINGGLYFQLSTAKTVYNEEASLDIWRAKERAMLVLSRKKNESIVINDDITIVVVEIRGDKVRLGVEAPKEVLVHRREVFDAIHRNENIVESKTAEKTNAAETSGNA